MLAAISATIALGIDMALPAFGEIRDGLDLAPESPRVAMTVTLYFLGMASAQLFYGPFADRFGRKPVLYVGLSIYALGALGSALAPTFELLIASRFVWGIGAAGPRSLSLAIGRDLYDGDRLARILAVVAAIFMVVPALAPLFGEAILRVASWRWVMGAPIGVTAVLALWLTRLPESLPPERRSPLSFRQTRTAVGLVLADRQTFRLTLALMFDFGAFFAFLGSSQLLFEDVYDRGDQFGYYFGAMSLVMGIVAFAGSRLVSSRGVEHIIGRALPTMVLLSILFLLWTLQSNGKPMFLGWMVIITAINSLRTLVNSLLQAQAMEPMGELAGTAAAVIGTITTAGGAILAGIVDRAIDGSITPLAIGYAGYAVLSAGLVVSARAPKVVQPLQT